MNSDIPIFTSSYVQELFADKHIVVIGDSVQRSVYKDLVCLLREDKLLTLGELKEKGEKSFQGDTLLEGGVLEGLHNGTNYKEVRKFEQGNTTIMFYFVTRCYNEFMQSVLNEFKLDQPHVIIMNSCLWDLHRYGKTANDDFLRNIAELLKAIDLAVPFEESLFIWNATLPVREKVKAGFLPPGMERTLPAEDIRKANLYVRDQFNEYGDRFIFLDLHQVFYTRLHLRVKDGVHWNDFAHRKITCLILTEIAKRWNFEVPSKSPLPSVHVDTSPVSYSRSVNTIPLPAPRPLLSVGHRMNQPMGFGLADRNGYPEDYPLGNGPRRNGSLRHAVADGPVRGSPPGIGPMRNHCLPNAPVRGGRGRTPRLATHRGRTRSATAIPMGFRPLPPRGWANGPRFPSNGFSPPGFLNETFPPFPRKRKFSDDDNISQEYKFPRKFT